MGDAGTKASNMMGDAGTTASKAASDAKNEASKISQVFHLFLFLSWIIIEYFADFFIIQ